MSSEGVFQIEWECIAGVSLTGPRKGQDLCATKVVTPGDAAEAK